MKKIISLSFIIMMIVGLFVLTGCNKKYEKYYKTTYSSTYNSIGILNGKNYEIVTNRTRLNEICSKVSNNEYSKKIDDTFFKNNNLLVIEGGIESEINKIDVTETKANIEIYYGSPLVSADEKLDFDIYLVPIGKEVKDINVVTSVFPDRMY